MSRVSPRSPRPDSMSFDGDNDGFLRQNGSGLAAPRSRPSLAGGPSPIQIDEEVVVKNKRKPAVKLIDRLLADKGLRQLKTDAPKHLNFRGKGHEKQDLMRLVNYYQLWMHEVFPKATFRDCIAMTEKAGHENQVRVVRKEWIEATKARQVVPDEPIDWDALQALADAEKAGEKGTVSGGRGSRGGSVEAWSQDEVVVMGMTATENEMQKEEPWFVDDGSDIDTDELLQGTQKQREEEMVEERDSGKPTDGDEFEDEMIALNEMDFDM